MQEECNCVVIHYTSRYNNKKTVVEKKRSNIMNCVIKISTRQTGGEDKGWAKEQNQKKS